jgi:tRNA nucleotidyltransferase (CCA-adding enzyme)
VARRLGGEAVEHERFATAKVRLGDIELDLAATREEEYSRPGALPDVRPAGIEQDLARRDFTVNSMALPLDGAPRLLDPHGGLDDLEGGVLRVLHAGSFRDDPTRALRAARYAARFGLEPDDETRRLLADADLTTVSDDRRRAELLRIAVEPAPAAALALLGEWGVLGLAPGTTDLVESVSELLAAPPWSEVAERDRTVLAAVEGPSERARELAETRPGRPSEGVELARGARPEELALARAMGGDWLDRYIADWRSVVLEIGGQDLIEAGVAEGPDVGRGLAAALTAKLDGQVQGREAELRVALEAAKRS